MSITDRRVNFSFRASATYSSFRSSRAPVATQGAQYTQDGLKVLASQPSKGTRATAIEHITEIFYNANLPGPVILIDDDQMIGRGSQFVVYKRRMAMPETNNYSLRDVAVKMPRFQLDPHKPHQIGDREAQKHLHDIYLEVLALTNPTLRQHPNIVRLFGWSYETYSYNTPLFLVVELASSSLGEFLKTHPAGLVRFDFCKDVAAGLDVLHECGIVHGDLKPDNVLIFPLRNGSHVAKLADFGLSIDEASSTSDQIHVGGTQGWQAPEIIDGRGVKLGFLPHTDSFAFGLLIWSVMFLDGDLPPNPSDGDRRSIALEQAIKGGEKISGILLGLTKDALGQLLRHEPAERPYTVGTLLCHEETSEAPIIRDMNRFSIASNSTDSSDYVDYTYNSVHYEGPYFSWEIPTLPAIFVRDIFSRSLQSPDTLQADTLFGIFLAVSAYPTSVNASSQDIMEVLVASASKGSLLAQGIFEPMMKYFEIELEHVLKEQISRWARDALSTGFCFATQTQEQFGEDIKSEALIEFKKDGGYGPHYSRIGAMQDSYSYERSEEFSKLHWLAAYGSPEDVEKFLDTDASIELDRLSGDEETPLYLSCARGFWQIARALLDKGANAAIKCTPMKISCLHWIFAFDERDQDIAAHRLIAAGNDVNAMVPEVTPFLHYPFTLPPGTALHWAVNLRAYRTIETLMKHGARLDVRNGFDSYTYDDRVRILDKFGGPNMVAYSLPKDNLLGITPLDYAAMAQDPVIFELLIESESSVDINDTDEEGLNVLHRLSTDPKRRTRNGNIYLDRLFRGTLTAQKQRLQRTVDAILSLGGNLEQLTTPVDRADQNYDRQPSIRFPQLTPLIMAVSGGAVDVVEALLVAGADVNAQDSSGRTALMCMPEKNETITKLMSILITYEANVNHVSHSGASAITTAATRKSPQMVDLLLSKGADIESTIPMTQDLLPREGRGVISLLAWQEPPLEDQYDQTIAELLEKHVFSITEKDKKTRILARGDIDGRTPLHDFVGHFMPKCVQALLSHGAPVNAIEYCFRRERDQDTSIKIWWTETPLDLALKRRDEQFLEADRKSLFMAQENERLYEKAQEIIRLLENAHGVTVASEKHRKCFSFDKQKYGARGFVRALREC